MKKYTIMLMVVALSSCQKSSIDEGSKSLETLERRVELLEKQVGELLGDKVKVSLIGDRMGGDSEVREVKD